MNFFFLLNTLVILFSTIMVFLKTLINSTLCLCSILILSIITLFLFLFVIIMLNLTIESITKTTDFKLLSGPSILLLLILKLQNSKSYTFFFILLNNFTLLTIKCYQNL